ncbi:aminotransferase-like domain-containing protein [Actinophytocola algeriensis]|uniref:(S)-3,5-dihydroxyphenylglycine transaminase n=1 Tax=Actinophytocola algeriensis TaxID=1768010 RepID=A0A7W7QFM9_9PSEU|nr:PLP-dependent aminotransferase family protein [Actinophytocola algeriensis]MBB4912221.1 (S)-3,5-dihydroxyphenylglycine transaminase [Actinophytocola algeriensis]MBE1474263.1 (S)-3,5-dihydroxyphenylglycine transaminase [Actinophytocola algeriensis]
MTVVDLTGALSEDRSPAVVLAPVAELPPRRTPVRTDLSTEELHPSLEDPALTSMNLLNEIANHYPDAVSFAAGRPYEEFWDVDDLPRYLARFTEHLRTDLGYSEERVRRTLFQYGRTKGIVHELVAANLELDEDIRVDPESIVVTVGCQEAMVLVLRALRSGPKDVLLAVSPTYVGLTGAARLVDMPVLPVASGAAGIDFDDLLDQVQGARAAGLRPRALYVMPDFANPSGVSMTEKTRRTLLQLAREEDFLLLEDNPYGLFHSGERVPTCKALDEQRRVVYLGSFAKTVLPGARVGYVVADQTVTGPDGSAGLLADELSKIKSMLTVNTPALAQAIVGGKLLEHGCSLVQANEGVREVYAANRARLADGLAARFGTGSPVTWNAPAGGFFVVVTVPFPADDALLTRSARDYGVLWTPMHHFYDVDGHGRNGTRSLRLSCSVLTPEQIDTGLDRLALFITDELARTRRGAEVR